MGSFRVRVRFWLGPCHVVFACTFKLDIFFKFFFNLLGLGFIYLFIFTVQLFSRRTVVASLARALFKSQIHVQ